MTCPLVRDPLCENGLPMSAWRWVLVVPLLAVAAAPIGYARGHEHRPGDEVSALARRFTSVGVGSDASHG